MMQQIANFIVDHDPMMVIRRTHDTVRYIRWAWNKNHADPIDEEELRLFLCDEHYGDLTDEQKPSMTDFKPYVGRKRRSGTGCVSEINDHLFEGRYSPKWPDGKKHARNIYAHTREECEEKLKVLIVEMKAEIAEAQRLMELGEGDGRPSEEKQGKRGRKET